MHRGRVTAGELLSCPEQDPLPFTPFEATPSTCLSICLKHLASKVKSRTLFYVARFHVQHMESDALKKKLALIREMPRIRQWDIVDMTSETCWAQKQSETLPLSRVQVPRSELQAGTSILLRPRTLNPLLKAWGRVFVPENLQIIYFPII